MNLAPRTYLVFGFALAAQVIASIIWYASSPHLTRLSSYLPYIWFLFSGLLVGLLDNYGYLRKTLMLGVLMSFINAMIHWSAGQFGIPVDFGEASYSVIFAFISMPIFIVLSMLGGWLGSLVYRLAIQRKRIN